MRGLKPLGSSLPLLLAIATACSIEHGDVRTPSGEPPEPDSARVSKIIDAVSNGFETGDLTPLDTLYHPDVLIYEWGSVSRSWETYRDEHLAPELDAFDDRRFILEDRNIRVAGNTAWATFSYTMEAGPQEDRLYASGVGTMIFQKLRGRWLIVHSHTSAGF